MQLGQISLRPRASRGLPFGMFQFVGQPLCLFFAYAQLFSKLGDKQPRCSHLLAGGGQNRVHVALRLCLCAYRPHFRGGTLHQMES
ncbi:MAG: hypothetical protein QOG66_2398 [Methylobacteriaceae bacterium]|nr:hypothetical protein [Methylobacteriaceae bacterium]